MSEGKVVEYTEQAVAVVSAMHERVQALGRHFGENSPEYTTAATSLMRELTRIVQGGFDNKATVMRDGDLSLLVREGSFTYGIIFFRNRAWDGQDVPQPGAWSAHS